MARAYRTDLDATTVPSDEDIAWAAGIYEGEGYCTFLNSVRVAVSQKDPELLYRLRNLFGGRIWTPTVKKSPSYIPMWTLVAERAKIFLWLISPHLTNRRLKQIAKVCPEVL